MVSDHRDLEAWQLTDQVRRAFIELTSREGVRRDFNFCDQSNSAATSACRNIAEGFARFLHPDNARFVTVALGSLGELLDSTDEALTKHYIDEAEHKRFNELIEHAKAVNTGWLQHLLSTPTPSRLRRR
jgi:four helix bundle protein